MVTVEEANEYDLWASPVAPPMLTAVKAPA